MRADSTTNNSITFEHTATDALQREIVVLRQQLAAMQQQLVALEDTAHLQQAVLDSANYSIISTDVDGIVRTFNITAERWLGYSADEVIGKTTSILFHDRDEVFQHVAALSEELGRPVTPGELFVVGLHRGAPKENVWTYVRKDGSRFRVRMSLTAIYDDQQRLTGFLGIGSDISEREHAQAALRASENRFQAIFDQTFQFAGVMTPVGVVIDVNASALAIAGVDREDVIGKFFWNCAWWQNLPETQEQLRAAIFAAAQGQFFRAELPYYAAGHTLSTVDFSLKPVADANGTVTFIIPEGHDISAQKALEAELRHANADLEARVAHRTTELMATNTQLHERQRFIERVATLSPSTIYVYDLNQQQFVYTNDLTYNILGYDTATPAHTTYAWFLQQIHFDDREWVIKRRKQLCNLADGDIEEFEFRMRHKDGTWRWFNVREATFARTDGGELTQVVGLILEITDQKQAEADHRELERKLFEAQKLESLGVLAGGIAHDFNNILTGIIGNAGIALTDIPPENPAHEAITQIERAGLRAADLAHQMLAYSGRGQFVIEPLDLNALIVEMNTLITASVPKHVQIITYLAADLPLLAADATQLRQVIMNLIINAAESISDERGTVTVTTHQQLVVVDATESAVSQLCVVVTVADTGCGMDAATQQKIFDPFFTTKFTGRGLGLAAVQGIVQGHGGTLQVQSAVGNGTTMTICLPAPSNTLRPVAAPSSTTQAWECTGMFLVVDDESAVRLLVMNVLEHWGCTVLEADDGDVALALARPRIASLAGVVLDVTMPRMNGVATLAALRELRADLPVMLMSGYSNQEIAPDFAQYEQVRFLQKPFRLEDLRDQLCHLVPPNPPKHNHEG